MKITKDVKGNSITVSDLSIQKTGHGIKLEPVFVVRAGDEYFDKTIGFYKTLAHRNFPPLSQQSLENLIQEGKNWPKHRTDGKVEYEDLKASAMGLMEDQYIGDVTLGEQYSANLNETVKKLCSSDGPIFDVAWWGKPERLQTVNTLLDSLSALVAEGGPGIMAKIKSVVGQIEEARK